LRRERTRTVFDEPWRSGRRGKTERWREAGGGAIPLRLSLRPKRSALRAPQGFATGGAEETSKAPKTTIQLGEQRRKRKNTTPRINTLGVAKPDDQKGPNQVDKTKPCHHRTPKYYYAYHNGGRQDLRKCIDAEPSGQKGAASALVISIRSYPATLVAAQVVAPALGLGVTNRASGAGVPGV